jgi:hypothetical protein
LAAATYETMVSSQSHVPNTRCAIPSGDESGAGCSHRGRADVIHSQYLWHRRNERW